MIHNKRPAVSIITVCYNEKNIENTCKSVVNQTFRDFEWIVVDGGSTDGTVDTLEKYRNDIAIFISEKDKGIYDAMNKGIGLAKGKWLIFMNGGDCFYGTESLKKVFSCEHDCDMIFADGVNNIYSTKHPLPINKDGKIILHKFFCDNSLCHQATFIKKDIFDKVGPYDTTYKIIADHVFNYTALKNFKATYEYVPESVALIDLSGVSMSNRTALEGELLRLRREKYDFFIEMLIGIDKAISLIFKHS